MMLVSLAKMTEVVNLKNTSRKKRQNRNENKTRGVSFELQISKRQLNIYIQVRKRRGKKKKIKKFEGKKTAARSQGILILIFTLQDRTLLSLWFRQWPGVENSAG
jgi:hypothetical protein